MINGTAQHAESGARHAVLLITVVCSLLLVAPTEARATGGRPSRIGADHQPSGARSQPHAGANSEIRSPVVGSSASGAAANRPVATATAQPTENGNPGVAVTNGITATGTTTADANLDGATSVATSDASIGAPSPIGGLVAILAMIAAIVLALGGVLGLAIWTERSPKRARSMGRG